MRSFSNIFLSVLTLLYFSATSNADAIDGAYQTAMKSVSQGKYKTAISELERIVAVPVHHEDLFYNLGFAYFRIGKLGPAIYNFERSLKLDPNSEDAKFNLETAKAIVALQTKDVLKGALAKAGYERFISKLSLFGWTSLFLLFWWVFFLLWFLLRRVEPGPARSGLIAANALCAILVLSAGLLVAGKIYVTQKVQTGIVLSEKILVREGPAESARQTFELHAGFRVQAIEKDSAGEQDSGWVRIRLANGLEGWIEQKELGML